MSAVFAMIVPALLAGICLFAAFRKTDVYTAAAAGAAEGLKTCARIFPALVLLLSASAMFRASGAMELFVRALAPLLSKVGIPAETAPLMLIRPLSGSGALAAGADIINEYGADSLIGRTAAVMLGSTETTFYVIAVYFGAAKIKKTGFAIPAAIAADIAGFLTAALTARLFRG